MESFERARIEAFLCRIAQCFPVAIAASSVVITHLLAERPAFLNAINAMTPVMAVLPKPKSTCQTALEEVKAKLPIGTLSRDQFSDPGAAIGYLEDVAAGQRLVLLDIGGYFAPCLKEICACFSGTIAGVVEDTENGLHRYERLDKLPCPVISVARSPLKEPEDFLVGQSVVFSTEALVRSRGDILGGRDACVIGFGKLGRSIAQMLQDKSLRVTIYDDDPVTLTHALSHGYRTAPTRTEAIRGAGLVICATGNLSLRREDFSAVSDGAYLASVTSSDDELELSALSGLYRRSACAENITRYATAGQYFYVLADGNAVNFLHGASVGAFIHLVQGEIIAAIALLAAGGLDNGLHEVDAESRRLIARTWLGYFSR
jgi:adenosylhomocysteinase